MVGLFGALATEEISAQVNQHRFAGREWYLRLQIGTTQDARIRRLDVQVFADAQRSDAVAQLTGFAGDSVLP